MPAELQDNANPDEVLRLQRVYQGYADEGCSQSRWDETNPGNQAILRERDLAVRETLRDAGLLPLGARRILDVGCGSGRVLAGCLELGAVPENLHGIDLLSERIRNAQEKHPRMKFSVANAERIDFPDGTFDLVLLYTVFTSILDDRMARNVAGGVARVLKPGGSAVWYDFRFNNPRNPNVRGLSLSAVKGLFPGFEPRLRTVTLLPPLARRLGRLTSALYSLLAAVPLLRTHYVGLLTKPASS